MGFYDDMADVASEVLAEFKQGVVTLVRSTTTIPDPAEPWNKTVTTASYSLNASVRRVEGDYVDGALILATDNQVTFAVPAVTPVLADKITIDGVAHAIKDLRPIPAAGTPVAYIAFVAA
jgi:hypothetical protein